MPRWLPSLLLLSACGGSPSAPTAPPIPAPLVVTDTLNGITGERVKGTIVQSGGVVTVSAPGFLTREQPVANPVWLWPQSEAYVKALVYTVNDNRINLIRWAPGSTIRLAFGPRLSGYSGAMDRLEDCASELRRWSKLPVLIGEPANVTLDIDSLPSGLLARTTWSLSGQTITGARVTFLDRASVTGGSGGNTMLHELGHVLGLAGHSPLQSDVMSVLPNRNGSQTFSGDEAASLTMIYEWRKAGNQFPDREPVGLASKARWTLTVEN